MAGWRVVCGGMDCCMWWEDAVNEKNPVPGGAGFSNKKRMSKNVCWVIKALCFFSQAGMPAYLAFSQVGMAAYPGQLASMTGMTSISTSSFLASSLSLMGKRMPARLGWESSMSTCSVSRLVIISLRNLALNPMSMGSPS